MEQVVSFLGVHRNVNEEKITMSEGLDGRQQNRRMSHIVVLLLAVVYIFSVIAIILAVALFLGIPAENLKIAYRLYRGPLLIIQFLFFIGIDVYSWRSFGVNHVGLLELDPRNHLSEQHLIQMAAAFSGIWTLSILSFLINTALGINKFLDPLTLTVSMVIFLLNPFKVWRHNSRFWLIRKICRIIVTPYNRVGFADVWLANQFCSLVTAWLDFQFLTCFYFINGDWWTAQDSRECVENDFIIRPIVNCLPAWFRFAQCLRRYWDSKDMFPHLVNAGKYSTTFLVVTFATLQNFHRSKYENTFDNPYTMLWILSSVISSSYAYTWDIKMDWGLFDKNANKNTFLRGEVVYSSKLVYYFAMIEDFVLRFTWALAFFLTEFGYIGTDMMTSIVATLEVFRRFVWNLFRLEKEHLKKLNHHGQTIDEEKGSLAVENEVNTG